MDKVVDCDQHNNDQLPLSWPDSSTDRALHQHHRGQGASPIQPFFYLLLLKKHGKIVRIIIIKIIISTRSLNEIS